MKSRKKKKSLRKLFITIIIISLILVGLLLFFGKDNMLFLGNNIGGEKKSNNFHAFDIEKNRDSIYDYYISDEYIYYLVGYQDKGETVLYSLNYKNDKINKINTFKENYCDFLDDYIECITENVENIYGFDSKKIVKTTLNDGESLLKYNGKFLKTKYNDLYNINNEFVMEVADDYDGYQYLDYYSYKNNLYILLRNTFDDGYLLYDYKNDKYEKLLYTNYFKVNDGFYFCDNENIMFRDLINNKSEEFKYGLYNYDLFISTVDFNNRVFYIYNKSKEVIQCIYLKDSKVYEIPFELEDDKIVMNIDYFNNKLFVRVYSEEEEFLIYDLNKINSKDIKSIKEYKDDVDKELKSIIKDLKDKYNVNLHLYTENSISFPDFSAKSYKNTEVLLARSKEIKQIVSKFDKNVFDSFYDENFNGLHIYLTGELTPSDYGSQYATPAAYSLTFNDQYMIVLSMEELSVKSNVCHELMHNLETNLNYKGEYFNDWDKYNPKNYKYSYSYVGKYRDDYTLSETDKNKVYFTDYYSHTFPNEDRARIFENICNERENDIIKIYPNLKKKGEYLRGVLYKYYPSLENDTVFDSLK